VTEHKPSDKDTTPRDQAWVSQNTPGQSASARLAEMLRVDHAGEYGAVRIYEGQLAVLRNRPGAEEAVAAIEEMAAQEAEHLETFDKILIDKRVRPTALTPFWHVAGFALGAGTALLGEKAAMACTTAVEDVIDEHYTAQLDTLALQGETELAETIEKFRQDEVDHRNAALEAGATEAPAFPLLSGAIKAACRVAIAVSEKV